MKDHIKRINSSLYKISGSALKNSPIKKHVVGDDSDEDTEEENSISVPNQVSAASISSNNEVEHQRIPIQKENSRQILDLADNRVIKLFEISKIGKKMFSAFMFPLLIQFKPLLQYKSEQSCTVILTETESELNLSQN